MLPQFSVRKPYTVLVAVVLVLVLGVISFTGMTTDLLPAMELPYVVVMTTYPGASPEKIETTVTKPLEAVLGTTGGIKNVSSVSSENASIVILEFEQGTNMDSAMIELSSNVDLVSGQMDDAVGTPMLMKISPDMLPVMVASVDMDGMDVKEISAFADETVMPAFERIDGVASVDATGLVEQQVTVTLDQVKIDALNDKVLAGVDSGLADAQRELREGQAKVADGKAKLAEGEAALESQKGSALDKLAQGSAQVDGASATLSALLSEETTLTANQKAFEAERDGYTHAKQGYEGINTALAGARDTARQAAAAAAKQGVLDSVNALLAQMGRPAVGTYEEAAAVYAQLQQTQPGLPALPDPAVVGEQAAAAVPANVDALLALDDASFEAFKAQAGALPGGEQLAALTKESLTQLRDAALRADTRLPEVEAELSNITTRLAVISGMKPALEENLKKAQDAYAELEKGKMTAVNELTRGEVTLSTTKTQLEDAEQKLADAQEQFDQARDAAYKKADLSGVLTADMLGNILMAQNFNMPAGYITEGEEQYLVKVGEEYASLEELENTLLMHMDVDGVGDVRLSDVADIALTDNAGESYAKVNGNDGVVLSFQKQSTASTATVSQRINSAIAQLQEQNPGLHITPLMDQGDYIDMVVGSVLSNLLWGGLLAIIVLIFFLKDAKPTFIVACSIPFSLMCAITLMYFTAEHHLAVGPCAGRGHAGGQQHCCHRKYLSSAFSGRACLQGGHPGGEAGVRRYFCLHAHHHMCVPAHCVHAGHFPRAVHGYGPDHCLFAAGQPGGSPDAGACHGCRRAEKHQREKPQVVRRLCGGIPEDAGLGAAAQSAGAVGRDGAAGHQHFPDNADGHSLHPGDGQPADVGHTDDAQGRGAAGCLCHGGYRHGAHRGRGWCGDRRRDVRRQRYVLDDGRLVLRRQHHLLYPAV